MRTITDIPPMPIDPRLLTLTQLLSPAFPTGAFAYSHGVEMAIHAGWVHDADSLQDWLRDCLTDGTGHSDAIWLRLAYETDDPRAIDAQARSFVPACERQREADRQGAAFGNTVNAVWSLDLPPLLLPVAVGRTAGLMQLDVDAATGLYLQAMVTNLVSAAIRLHLIGQTAGQHVIVQLQPVCSAVAEDTQNAAIDQIFGNAFLSDIAAMTHETLEPRLFQS